MTSSGDAIGGLVGRNVEGTITESVASGAVTGIDYVGGLVGHDRGVSSGDSISASRASGNVTGSGERVGGLVGWAAGTIRASYATGTVTGATWVGGLVGRLVGAIITSYASGGVSGSGDAVGGLVGFSSAQDASSAASSVLASYATGSVSGGATATNHLGGLIGVAQAPTGTFSSPSFTDSYWDTERSSRSIGVGSDDVDADGSINGSETATSGVTGQTTSALQMPTGYTGIYANWNIAAGDPWNFGGGTDDPELRAPPNASPAFSSTAVLLTVAEDAAVGSNVGAAVTATDSDGDTLAYKLVGAGVAAFDIGSATGQLQVGAALDHETDGSYTVTVQGSDGRSVAFKEVTVTVTGVDEPPALSGDDAPAVADDGAVFVSTYTVADPEGDAVGAITWSLAGADSSSFTIEDGRLSFRATPDYEDPNHAAGYDVTVQAAVAGQSSPLTLAVTATVVNIDEAGVVSLSTAQPEDDVALTATLSDLDGGVSGLTWRWRRATTTDGPWTTILGRRARSDTYTPDRNDAGHYLQVTASYSDAEGPMKSAQAITDNPMGMATPRVIVSPTELSVNEGRSRTYAVVLNTQPSGDVMVAISSDNTDVTVNPANLTFTTANWETAQTVTVSAAEDYDALQDTATVTHDPSGADYDSVSNADLPITVPENDSLGVTAWPRSLRVSEGGSNTYTVSLDTQPTGDVTVTISSDNPDVTVSPSILTFTTTDWGTRQRVTITAGRDGDAADDMATLTHDPSGADYDSVSNADIAVTVTDYDIPGVTVSPTWLPVNEGSTNTYTVVLDTLPSGDVTVAISSDNTDVTVSSPSLTFTTTNWDTAQTVTVSAAQDADLEDDTATVMHDPSGADYNSVSNADLAVTVGDRDAPGVTVDPLSLTVTVGGSSTYTVRLNTQPSGDVTVYISSGRKVTVSPSSLTFTTTNWGAAQTVTVSAAEDYDRLQDTVQVVNNANGADYDSVSNASLTVTIIDNDTPGVTVTPTSLTVGEGGSGTYTVVLDTLPSGDVTVAISSDNADVTADTASLMFSTSNWATPQTVTVSAAEDEDRLQDTAMVTHDPSGADYDSVSNADLAVTVTDNDTRGVTVEPTELTIAEGGSGTYTVVLNTLPSAAVTVAINDPTGNTDVTASPASLSFSTTDWATAQTVTVSAAEDGDPLEDTATVTHTVSGGDYEDITAQDVDVTVTDNDTRGVTVSPTSLTVNEGSTNTYTVQLDTQPSGNVNVYIISINPDVTVPSSKLTFTAGNWNSAQTVTVTAGQDADAADDMLILIHKPGGSDYGSVDDVDLAVTVNDDDTAGVTVTPTSLTVNEGGANTYTVVLDTQPKRTVTVTIVDPTDNADVTANPASLRFTPGNWATAQTVTVSAGPDDDTADHTATVTHTVSTRDGDYAGVTVDDVAVTVTDYDIPGVTVSPTSLTIDEGNTDTYTVELNTQPSGDVMVDISSNNTDVTVSSSPLTFTTTNWNSAQTVTVTAGQDADAADDMATLTHNPSGADYGSVSNASLTVTVTEGGMNTYTVVLDTQPTATVTVTIVDPTDNADVTADPASLTFTTSNWSTAKTVTVSADEDDDHSQDTATVTHTVSGGNYASFAASNVAVTVTDNDTPGVTVAPTSLTVGEGDMGTYTVKLNTQPSGDVMVDISSNNTDVTVSPSSLTFTAGNWNSAQTVTVSAGQDADAADDMATLTHNPSGADYGSVGDADLAVTVTDDETVGVTVTSTSLTVNEGGTNTYTVVLDTQPTATVTVTIVDPTDNADVTADPASLTFTTTNWATVQTVTVSADEDDDHSQDTATVTHTVSGGNYASFAASNVAVTVTDNDTPGVTVAPTSLTVGEGDMGTYTVVLDTQPTATVTVTIVDPTDNADVTADPASLTFTTTNWDTAQTVTVSAAEDGDPLKDTATVTHTVSGGDYAAITAQDVAVTVTDNDTPGVTVSPTSLTVNEGSTNTYTVQLDTLPTGNVTVRIGLNNPDVTVSPSPLTFTTTNWNSAQTVTVTAGQDADAADDMATLTHNPSGADYGSVSNARLRVTVTDDETAGVTVTPTSLTLTEGGTNTYTVVLDTQPTGTVTVTIVDPTDNADVTANPASLTFTTTNWDTAKTVTVSAAEDGDPLEDTATVTHTVSGGDYAAITAQDVAVTVTDNDTPGVAVSPTSLTIIEGNTDAYTVVLDTLPTGNVTVVISPNNTDVTVSPSSLTFTAGNWNSTQWVRVSAGQDDDAANDMATLTHNPSGADYGSVSNADLAVTVIDDETAGVTVTPTSLTVNEGGMNTYTVVLDTQPTATVTVTIVDPTDNADVTANPASLTFTTSNWDTAQTVTVTAVDDEIDEDAETVNLTHSASGGGYGSVTAVTVTVTVNDDDTRGVTVAPTSLTIDEGNTDTYTVELNTLPTGDVMVDIGSSNPDVTVSPSSLTFTTTNWNSAQTVTVTAGQDFDAWFDRSTLTHNPSGADYGSVSNAILKVTVTDDDTAGVTVTPLSLTIGEGGTGTYTVRLNTSPIGRVLVAISSNNTDVTVRKSSLRFSTANWNRRATVTVTARLDADAADDMATLTHTVTGGDYNFVFYVIVTVTDYETGGVTFRPTSSLTVGEGGTGRYGVRLSTQPSGTVTVTISSNNTDVTVNKSSLTFNKATYTKVQGVTVTAGQDDDAANDMATLTHNPSGADYDSVGDADLAVTVTDDETAGVTVTPTSLTVTEGDSGTYTVVLDTQPTGDVTVTIVDPTDNTDVKAEPAALTFTTTNWNSAQTVTVSAVLDADTDDDTATVTHTVSGYGSVSSAASVTVTVAEDPTAPYDTNENSLIDKDEASVSVRGYLSDGTPPKAVASAVVRRYLSGE